jgi:hypothetical protein
MPAAAASRRSTLGQQHDDDRSNRGADAARPQIAMPVRRTRWSQRQRERAEVADRRKPTIRSTPSSGETDWIVLTAVRRQSTEEITGLA